MRDPRATINFRAKVERVYTPEGDLAYETVKVPKIDRKHCNMDAFRRHAKIGPYANSELFAAILARELRGLNVKSHIRLDQVPAGVTVDASGFLAAVTIEVA